MGSPPDVKRLGYEIGHSAPLEQRLRMTGEIHLSPLRLHGIEWSIYTLYLKQ